MPLEHSKTSSTAETMASRSNRTFNAYLARVFLYNSELWALTKKQEHTIDTPTQAPEKNPRSSLAKEHQ